MKKNILSIITFLFVIFLSSCINDPTKEAEALAKKWCTCNKDLVPLYNQLEAASTPQEKRNALDQMHQLVAQNMPCLGGEHKWEQRNQQMSTTEKAKFLKVFKRTKEEQCPEIFQIIAALEENIKK